MPRFRQYAVYPYEAEFGFSPGFYGPGASRMEVKALSGARACPRGKVRSRKGKCVPPIRYKAKRGKLYGWRKDLPESARHERVVRAVRKDGYATAVQRLSYLVNISADEETRRIARTDMEWLRKNRMAIETRRAAAGIGAHRLTRSQRMIKGLVETRYDSAKIPKGFWFVAVPLGALVAAGAVAAIRSRRPAEPAPVAGLGDGDWGSVNLTLFPGLADSLGPIGAAFPYVAGAGALGFSARLVPDDWKPVKVGLLIASVGLAGLAVWAGLSESKRRKQQGAVGPEVQEVAKRGLSLSGEYFSFNTWLPPTIHHRFRLRVKNDRKVPDSVLLRVTQYREDPKPENLENVWPDEIVGIGPSTTVERVLEVKTPSFAIAPDRRVMSVAIYDPQTSERLAAQTYTFSLDLV